MSQSFLLARTVLFIPARNLLMAVENNSTQIALSNPASQCLLLLIRHHGQVVEREHFFQQVWLNNGVQVTNNNFYQNISLLRRAFKEFDLNDELIITVPKVGIRLSHELEIGSCDSEPNVPEIEIPAEPVATVLPEEPTPCPFRIWPVFACSVLIGLLGVFLTWRSEYDPDVQRFVLLEQSGECRIYGNRDVIDHARHKQFIQQNRFDCQHYPWVYLTLYPNVQRISVLRCREQYGVWQSSECTMSYYLKENSHADT